MEEHLHIGDRFQLAEIVGWWTVCISTGLGIGIVSQRFHRAGRGRYAVVGAVALALAFIALLVVEVQPATPDWVKDAFIGLLKVIGFLVIPTVATWLLWRRKGTATE